MKHKCVNKAMACVLAVGMTLTGCGKSAEPARETTAGGIGNTADTAEATAKEPGTTQGTQATEQTTKATESATVSGDSRFDALKRVAEQDVFSRVTVSHDRVLKCDSIKDEVLGTVKPRIRVMDKFGNVEFSYMPRSEGSFKFEAATGDGGILFVMSRVSADGVAECRIIKLGNDGNVQFETPLEGFNLDAFNYCYEADGSYYLFGTMKRVNTGIIDVYAFEIDPNGTVINQRKIGGGEDTKLILAEQSDDGFRLLVDTRSASGDFKDINFWADHINASVILDKDLNIQEMTKVETEELQEKPVTPLGEKAGKPVYGSDPLVQASGLEDPSLFIDYGDHYLIRGQREIGRFYSKGSNYEEALEKVYETVYTVYDMDGNVVFREAIDRSLEVGDPFARCLPTTQPSRTHDSEAWYCNQFMSVGEPPFSMPADAKQDENSVEGVYICSNGSRADYEDFLAGIKSRGFKRYPTDNVNYMFREDCLIVTWYNYISGSYQFYWYAGSVPVPEGGMSGEEAANWLLTERDERSSLSALHPVDVSPEGFYERTGGQLFVAPRYGNERWADLSLFYVKANEVWSSSLESVAVYDVDDDGKDEVLLLSYGPTSGLFTVTLECLTGEDNLDITLLSLNGSERNFNTDENGSLLIGNSYIGIKDVLGEKELLIYEEVIYESIDGEKTEYLQVDYGRGGPNYLKHLREGNNESIRIIRR